MTLGCGAPPEVASTSAALMAPEFEVVRDAPLPFVPFQLGDFRDDQGNALRPDAILTLADGQRRTAEEGLRLLNEAERATVEAGSTLRRGVRGIGEPLGAPFGPDVVKRPVQHTMVYDYRELGAQRAAYEAAFHPAPIAKIPSAGEALRKANQELQGRGKPPAGEEQPGRPDDPGKPDSADPDPDPNCVDELVEESDSWDFSLGSSGTIQALLEAHVHLSGNETRALFEGGGSASGSLFGVGFSILDGNGTFTGPAVGQGTGVVHVSVLGNDLFDGATKPGGSHRGDYTDKVRRSVTIPIANLLGIVSIDARVGVEGEAGFAFQVATGNDNLFVRGAVSPHASTSGFASVIAGPSIDLGIVSAELKVGVTGKLLFIEDTLAVSGNLFANDRSCLVYEWSYRGENSMSALDGHINLFAEAEGCVWNTCIGDRWVWRLFEWDGVGPEVSTVFEGSK